MLKDHHEGYIRWEQYEQNRQRIQANYSGPEGAGAPREGACLLQGLVLCGRCGRNMRILYSKVEGQARFCCNRAREQSGAGVCQSFGARRLEQAVEELLLASLAPLGMEAMARTAQLHTQDNQAQRVQWEQKIERARYEVELSRRQYDSVDPQNRLVARELERRFEKALKELEAVEANAAERLRQVEAPLSPDEEQQLKAYAEDVEKLWQAPGTRVQERKRIARCLLERGKLGSGINIQHLAMHFEPLAERSFRTRPAAKRRVARLTTCVLPSHNIAPIGSGPGYAGQVVSMWWKLQKIRWGSR